MNKLVKKHDPLTRKFLTDNTIAKEFLATYLSPEILDKVELNSLQIESGSYIEENLTTYYADLVYKLKLKNNTDDLYIYTLIEHQSKDEKLMPLRMLKYQLAVIQRHLDTYKNTDKLPVVVGLVFYNGKKSPYPYELDIANLFGDSELYNNAPLGKFNLLDLTVTEDSKLLEHGKLALLEILLKHIQKRDFNKTILLIIEALKVSLNSNISINLLNGAFSYLVNAKETEEIKQLIEQVNKNIPDLKENIMTYAEELRQEGELKGKQETQIEIAKKMLASGINENVISETTSLTLEKIKTLH